MHQPAQRTSRLRLGHVAAVQAELPMPIPFGLA